MTVQELNRSHGIEGVLSFAEGPGGLPTAFITSAHAEAAVCLYGAHVLGYCPRGKSEVFWMSSRSDFEEGKPIRGGIPVCFPWFGPHASDPQKPQHGFARLRIWSVAGTSVGTDGSIELRLRLGSDEKTAALWPYEFTAEVIVRVGAALDVTLSCTNTGSEEFTYSDALHSYFAVSDIANVTIRGLAGGAYYVGAATGTEMQREEPLEIKQEENRRYVGVESECIIEDAGMQRAITVEKRGSRVTVVWNPWQETAKNIADMDDEGYKTMICVEAVNAYDDMVTLKHAESFSMSTIVTVA